MTSFSDQAREIRFRAWDKQENKWLFGYDYPNLGGFSLIGEVVLLGELSGIPPEKWNDIEVMQYTGLLDKNDKQIYEGDIVDFGERNGRQQIMWSDEDGAWICDRSANGQILSQAWLGEVHDDCSVVGNIYETPELNKRTK